MQEKDGLLVRSHHSYAKLAGIVCKLNYIASFVLEDNSFILQEGLERLWRILGIQDGAVAHRREAIDEQS